MNPGLPRPKGETCDSEETGPQFLENPTDLGCPVPPSQPLQSRFLFGRNSSVARVGKRAGDHQRRTRLQGRRSDKYPPTCRSPSSQNRFLLRQSLRDCSSTPASDTACTRDDSNLWPLASEGKCSEQIRSWGRLASLSHSKEAGTMIMGRR